MKVTFLSQLGQFIFLSKLDNSLSTAFRKSLSNCFSSKSIDIRDFLGMKISPPTIAVAINKLYQKGVAKMTQLTVTIPEEYVLITREEYNELQEKEKPVWWSMQDLINETGFEYKWLRDNILMNPRYIKQLKHFVYYPDGGKWAFNREPMQKFLKDNFAEIFN